MSKIRILLIFVLMSIFFICSYLAYKEYRPVMDNKELNNDIREKAVSDVHYDNYLDREIDFAYLKSVNEDVVGWVYIPGTNIDYPIVIGEDDYEYLNKDFKGNKNPLGTLFTYSNTSRDLSDARVVIFGHNMRNGQMFGGLKKLLKDDYFESHKEMYLYTEEKSYKIGLFSAFVCSVKSDLFSTNYELGTGKYKMFLQDINFEGSYDDRIVSLVTCHGRSGTTERLMVNGVVKAEKDVSIR